MASSLALRVPPRPVHATGGRAFAEHIAKLSPGEREREIVEQIEQGNIPDFERSFVGVDVGPASRIYVAPDYLAIGSNDDFFRVPITIRAARRVARALGCVLPTPHIVDRIHASAKLKLTSPNMTPGDQMGSVAYFVAHNHEIEERRRASGVPLGALVSGPKKDLVLTKKMFGTPGHTPIYGWFGRDDVPIQPLSLTHDDTYVDYAHGIRLVDDRMIALGREQSVLDVLADPSAAALLSDEGAFDLRTIWARGY